MVLVSTIVRLPPFMSLVTTLIYYFFGGPAYGARCARLCPTDSGHRDELLLWNLSSVYIWDLLEFYPV
jgi:hypothetical protein